MRTDMRFKSQAHKDFYKAMINCTDANSVYHHAFIYTVGLSHDTRNHVQDIFDFKNNCINPEGLHSPWQTSGSRRITLMAFNMWNGYIEQGNEQESTPDNLFASSEAPYFFEAIRMRYPEYCKEIEGNKKEYEKEI